MKSSTHKLNQFAQSQIQDQVFLHINHTIIADQKLYEVKQSQMTEKLHKNQVAICWQKNVELGKGSGLLISRNLVLTCAHLFYNNMLRVEDQYFSIYPKHYGELKVPFQIERVYIPQGYHCKPHISNVQFDYALIKLTKMVDSNEFMILEGDAKFQTSDELAIFGYPKNEYKTIDKQSNREHVNQWGLKIKAAVETVVLQKKVIFHYVSTLPGQSGSPIARIKVNQNKRISVVGIHGGAVQSKETKKQINKGYYLTKQVIELLKAKATQMNAQLFKTEQDIAIKVKNKIVNKQAQQWNEKGDYYYESGMFQSAVKCYQQAVRLDEDYADAFVNLGLSLSKVGKKEEAVKSYYRAIEINPANQYAYNNLGIALRALKQPEEAISVYLKLIQINPKHAVAYNNLGLIYDDMKKRAQAAEYYKKAMQTDPNYHTPCHNLALNYQNTNQFQKAEQTYKKAIRMQPSYAEGYDGLASLLWKMGRSEESIPLFDKALKLETNHTSANKNKGIALIALQRFKQAIFYFQKALKINPNQVDIYFQLGYCNEVEGNINEAIRYYQQSIKFEYNKALALKKLAYLSNLSTC